MDTEYQNGDRTYDATRLADAARRRGISVERLSAAAAVRGFDMDVPRKTSMAAPPAGVDLAGPDTATRRALAARGEALPGGRFPIPDRAYLGKAIRAVGRAKGDHTLVRRYIIRRAKALGAADMIPAGWKPDGSLTLRAKLTRRGK